MTRIRCSGFSLLEALSTIFLIGLILVIVANLTSTMGTAGDVSTRVSEFRERVKHGMGRIRWDMVQSVEITDPAAVAPQRLEMIKYKTQCLIPGEGPRLVLPPDTSAAIWPVNDATFLEEVAYFLDGGLLKRKQGAEPAEPLFDAKDFEVTLSGELYSVTLLLEEDGKSKKYQSMVARF
jgi:hypothetical protein